MKKLILIIPLFLGLFLLNLQCHLPEPVDPSTIEVKDPTPDFAVSFDNAAETAPTNVTFTNLSKDAISYTWTFGDSTTNSTQASPTHFYKDHDTYKVTLEATNIKGIKKAITKNVKVKTITFERVFDVNSTPSNVG